jgi:hypothetical protein
MSTPLAGIDKLRKLAQLEDTIVAKALLLALDELIIMIGYRQSFADKIAALLEEHQL